jgi:hypothetical protein
MHVMYKLTLLLIALLATSGCESVWVVPPATGRVVDARSHQPVAKAEVIRICADAPANTKTDTDGYFTFRGKHALQLALGDPLCAPASYRIEAAGYQAAETNVFAFGMANQSGLRHNLGEISLTPK